MAESVAILSSVHRGLCLLEKAVDGSANGSLGRVDVMRILTPMRSVTFTQLAPNP